MTTYHGVVDVGGPHSGEEQQEHVCQVMDREQEQANDIWRGL